MKLLLLLLLPAISLAQAPPKKAKKIYVLTKDSVSDAIGKIALALFEHGFTIENKDEKLGFISSTEKSNKAYPISTKIRAVVKDTMIVFSGVFALEVDLFGTPSTGKSYNEVYYGGAKQSPLRAGWNELFAVASAMGKIIKYE
jgi:hypothetical protein